MSNKKDALLIWVNSLPPGYFFMFLSSADFFSKSTFKKFFEYYQSVKQFGFISGPTFLFSIVTFGDCPGIDSLGAIQCISNQYYNCASTAIEKKSFRGLSHINTFRTNLTLS